MSDNAQDIHWVLASGSPRRRELLNSLGLEFEVVIPNVDEAAIEETARAEQPNITASEIVEQLAVNKAHAVWQQLQPEAHTVSPVVIAADTLVEINGKTLSKPSSTADAFAMLNRLQGNTHQVATGVCVIHQNTVHSAVGISAVTMVALTEREINQYIETQEPMDKAGAYAIQGKGSLLISGISGCYFNVVGLPLSLLNSLLAHWDLSLL
ncbi:MAG: Maf family protein [Cyanobacteria bacterium]|nr:Maf family protein [Cyanobacteriota bacterium]